MDLAVSMKAVKDLFSFPFRDPKWQNKLLIGSGLSFASVLVPILPWLVIGGYFARLVRAGARNETPDRLPEWDNWGDMFMDGLRLMGSGLLFALPGALILGFGWVFYMAGTLSIAGVQTDSAGASGRAFFFLIALGVFFLTMGLGTLLLLASGLVSPAAVAHAVVQQKFSAVFQVRDWWRVLRANIGGFLLAAGLFLLMYMVIVLVWQLLYFTIVLCLFAPLITAPVIFYATVIYYRMVGQAYGEALERVEGQPVVTPEAPLALAGEG